MTLQKKIIGGGIIAVLVIVGLNIYRVNAPLQRVMRNVPDQTVIAYYRYGFVPDSIVYDLRDIGGSASAASVMGEFFYFAEAMKDRSFNNVRIAFRGKTKFVLGGDDFKEIGENWSWQNPVYVTRTFPEKLMTPAGEKAYDTWTGGLLDGAGRQMQDVNDFARKWFLEDFLRR